MNLLHLQYKAHTVLVEVSQSCIMQGSGTLKLEIVEFQENGQILVQRFYVVFFPPTCFASLLPGKPLCEPLTPLLFADILRLYELTCHVTCKNVSRPRYLNWMYSLKNTI